MTDLIKSINDSATEYSFKVVQQNSLITSSTTFTSRISTSAELRYNKTAKDVDKMIFEPS
ncbi:hypothetical protein PsorP6_008700 [Peronosclerospora sorghi]|uniref:Uncharacterized protein n=1 Tax=Peronosclerospora sorghi TaxID=230839 RepID=A0ACC0W2R6_9STRA|nr:hypothetical protein PsorP6_008700 [Peronosclerospora sorghi]